MMGFKSVYQTLKELFPQVDSRLLKAVAIEHPKDPDSAVEYILNAVLPTISDTSDAPTSVAENDCKTAETINASSSKGGSFSGDGAIASNLQNEGHNRDDNSVGLRYYDAHGNDDQVAEDPSNALTSLKTYEETSYECGQDEMSSVTAGMGGCSKDNCSESMADLDCVSSVPSQERNPDNVSIGNVENVQQDCSNVSRHDLNIVPVSDSLKEQPSGTSDSEERRVLTECAIKDQTSRALDLNSHPETETDPDFHYTNDQEMNSYLHSEFTRQFSETDVVRAENETMLSTIVTRSGQICRVGLLEDIIEEAKNYKETVCSAMESVVTLMEEVDLREKEAEQAKVASSREGLDILEKAEEIKKMLTHAKEANDMHAGEVYGEKSILATEVKELQVRLFCLSDEKDKSLLMLDEMRKSLEERLAVAEEQRKAAEKEMFDKEEIAKRALAEQELIMDKVVQDSKLLQREAEENAKLRDFLMERGQFVDVLQGEISVICQDVKMLKENFDNRISLSKSFSMDKTSSLASSSSSVKSSASLKSMTSLKSITSLRRSTSVKSTASSKSTVSVKSTASDVSDFAIDSMMLQDSQKTMTQSSSDRSEIGEKFVNLKATPQKTVSDDEWELCDLVV